MASVVTQNKCYSFTSFTGDGNAVLVDDTFSQCAMCSTVCVCVAFILHFVILTSKHAFKCGCSCENGFHHMEIKKGTKKKSLLQLQTEAHKN